MSGAQDQGRPSGTAASSCVGGGRVGRRPSAPESPTLLTATSPLTCPVPAPGRPAGGGQRAGGAPLGKSGNTPSRDPRGRAVGREETAEQREDRLSRERQGRRRRYSRRDQARAITSLPALRKCGASSTRSGGGTTLGVQHTVRGDRMAAFGSVSTCGSCWSCPQCMAKIAGHRRDELAEVMRAVDAIGGSAFLGTFTMRHQIGDRLGWTREQRRQAKRLADKRRDLRHRAKLGDEIDPDELTALDDAITALDAEGGCWEALSYGWGMATSGRHWLEDQQRHGGMLGWCRVVEVTRGANGWHVHVHVLFCYPQDVAVGQVRPIVERMFERWQRALRRRGFDASGDMGADGRIPGWDVRRAQLGNGDLSDYFTKIAHEVTGAHAKEGRRPGGRTPMQLLAEAVESYEVGALAAWWEYEAASAGHRQLEWSRGARSLRRFAELGQELTDEEAAAEVTEPDEQIGLSAEVWGWLRTGDHACDLLEVAEIGGMDAALSWLDDHGQTYVRGQGQGWAERPPPDPDREIDSWDGHRGIQLGTYPLDRGVGHGWSRARPAVLRHRTAAGTRLARPSDRPPRHTDEAWSIVRADPWDVDTYGGEHP